MVGGMDEQMKNGRTRAPPEAPLLHFLLGFQQVLFVLMSMGRGKMRLSLGS